MATPIGHALVGLGIHVASARDAAELRSPARALALVLAAIAADADLALRLVDGQNHHQGVTHSLGFALLVGIVAATAVWRWGARRAVRLGLLVALAWGSHGLVDFLSGDSSPPLGPMLFWPATRTHFLSPWSVFSDTVRSLHWPVVWHNAWALARELAILVPALAVVARLRGFTRRDVSFGDGWRR
jgi:membrane-bound metal-dependent hydrolase YbcI (DUF457 family)